MIRLMKETDTMTTNNKPTASPVRTIAVIAIVVVAFAGAYALAQTRSASPKPAAATPAGFEPVVPTPASSSADPQSSGGAAPGGAGGSNCACCNTSGQSTANGVTGDPAEKAATVSGNVQKAAVDVSQGFYQPNVIKLKAGVPAEITFGQGSGCTGQVMSKDLNFFEDISTGPKTVKLPALQPGEYSFSCGMQMVFGKIVVE
jgi:hypothetical protein